MKNYGYIQPEPDERDYKFGALPADNLTDGDWTGYLLKYEAQKRTFETANCTAFATLNCLEMLMLRKYGLKVNYSDRALGVLAGTRPSGNDPRTVAQTLRKFGVVDEEVWPFGGNSVEEYYQDLPKSVKKKCGKWLEIYEFGYERIDKDEIPEALKSSPLGVAVNAWFKDGRYYKRNGSDNHWTCLVAPRKVFDTYLDDGEPIKLLSDDYKLNIIMRYYVNKRYEYNPKSRGLWSIIINWLKSLWTK